jgi:hypothetical protein
MKSNSNKISSYCEAEWDKQPSVIPMASLATAAAAFFGFIICFHYHSHLLFDRLLF